MIALALLVLVNVGVQLNRPYFDVLSDGDFVMQRIQQCESLGRVPDALYLGSSRAVFSTSPGIIDGQVQRNTGRHILTCNAAVLTASIEQDYYTLKKFVADGFTPKLVVENLWEQNININSTNPVQGDDREQNWVNIQRLASLSDAGAIHARAGSDLRGTLDYANWLAEKLIPVYGDRVGLYNALCSNVHKGPCGVSTKTGDPYWIWRYGHADRQGFIPITDYSMAQLSPAIIQAGPPHNLFPWIHDELATFQIGGHQGEYLGNLIDLARQHGAKVVLVVSPLHPIYFRYFDRPTDWQMITSYWQSIADQHGATFYDESHLPGFANADFFDVHHLTQAGATKFSTWMARNVVQPILTASPG